MRKVESDMVKAINAGKNFKSGNTIVEHLPKYSGSPSATHDPGTVARIYLFGNMIAEYDSENKRLAVDDCGWQSNTTKSRLNVLLSEYADKNLYQSNFSWYCGGVKWAGGASFVNGKLV